MSFAFTDVGCIAGGFVGFDVGASGRPKASCGDTLYVAPAVTLAYGDRLTVGNISCVSQRFGMTCLNSEGNGFRLATNEIAMLYDRPPDWEAMSSSISDDLFAPKATSTIDRQAKVSTESGSTLCFLVRYDFLDPVIAFVECRPADSDMVYIGDDWSPDGRSCAGADFHGYYLDDDVRPEARRIATFGCTTDLSPLANTTVPADPIPDWEAVSLGGITCLSTGPAIACYNEDGNGVLTAPDEVSFFYDRDL